ncbi:hypothetical protein ID866_7371 [Astraeus odoratus]|nr:hypothetical protein ID866_7371 [Astraeus odoratus]
MPKASNSGYYAVRKGREPGIYLTWEDCQAQVNAFPGAVFKKLATEQEARAFLQAKTKVSPASAANVQSVPSTNRQPIASTSKALHSGGVQEAEEKEYDVVYCDGACKGNGRAGSVAGIGVWWGHGDPRNISERCPGDQTNNRAELIAIVRILETTPPLKRKLLIKTDSRYCIQCATSWIFKWMSNGFRALDGQPVKNRALIKYLAALLHARRTTAQIVEFKHVRGHVGLEGNEAADRLANMGAILPAVPERDWERLEKDVLKNVPEKRSKSNIEDLKAYADALLDDDDFVALNDSGMDNTKPLASGLTSSQATFNGREPAKHPPPKISKAELEARPTACSSCANSL